MAQSIDVEISVKSAAAMGALSGIAQSITSMGLAMAQAGIEAGIEAIGNSITLASDKAEAASKVNVLYGESADQIMTASEGAAESVGMSSGAYLESAGNLGNLLTNLGFAGEAAAGMSTDMIQLAADVGSFNNADPTEVVEAMGAAFRGESEPIRRFGVMLDEASIKTKAMELGLYSGVGAIDANAKAQATYALILEDTAAAQGDFARTSDGLANSQRIAAAKIEDAWTEVGEQLAPLAAEILPLLADALVEVIGWIGEAIDIVREWADDNGELIDTVLDVARAIFDQLVAALGHFVDIIGEAAYRIGGLIGAFLDLGGAIIDLSSALIHLTQGDFEGAAAAAERAMGRIQGFQENVQRAMGDTSRRASDLLLASAQEIEPVISEQQAKAIQTINGGWAAAVPPAEAAGIDVGEGIIGTLLGTIDRGQGDVESSLNETIVGPMVSIEQASKASGVEIGDGFVSVLLGSLNKGRAPVGGAAGDLGDEIPEGLEPGVEDAEDLAAQTPGELADALRSHRGAWQDALDTLGDDMKNSMDKTKEIAKIQGALAGKELARGLNSSDPIVRAQAEATKELMLDRLRELNGPAATAGERAGEAYARNFKTAAGNLLPKGSLLQGGGFDYWKSNSPPRIGPLKDLGKWGFNAGKSWADAFQEGATVGVPVLGAGGGAGGGPGGGGVTVNVYAGVGDPVAIGREVSEALRAYQRASGTVA